MSGSPAQRVAPFPLAIRVGWGAALLVFPGAVLRLFGGPNESGGSKLVMRILGGRHLVQAGAEYRFGGRAREVGVVVDLLHGATSVGLGLLRPEWRRAALTDAAVASGCSE
jgi:hypothetical protein